MTMPLEGSENTTALKRSLFALKDLRAKLDAIERARIEPIAIIGLGCRFPGGASTPEAYWKILNEGTDAIREVPSSRWDIEAYYDPDPDAPGKMYVRKSGFIDRVDQFEPQFFGISPREAASMDPQQRLLLEVTWETLEHAGIIPGELAGSTTGVFIGMSTNDYSGLQMKTADLSHIDAYIGTGTSFSVAAGRISYFLGLHGPTLTLDTACSSSLVAIHLACQSLRARQSNLVLAGGVSLILAPEGTISMSKSHALRQMAIARLLMSPLTVMRVEKGAAWSLSNAYLMRSPMVTIYWRLSRAQPLTMMGVAVVLQFQTAVHNRQLSSRRWKMLVVLNLGKFTLLKHTGPARNWEIR